MSQIEVTVRPEEMSVMLETILADCDRRGSRMMRVQLPAQCGDDPITAYKPKDEWRFFRNLALGQVPFIE
jgi:hypothetical protein